LDIDASIEPLYGKQEGALLGYNPHKPGRPSHVLHTYWVGNSRLVLDVQVAPGNLHSSAHAKAGLGHLLDELGEQRPGPIRGAVTMATKAYCWNVNNAISVIYFVCVRQKMCNALWLGNLPDQTGVVLTHRAARRWKTSSN
jgi:hypothetical protein